MFVAPTTSSYRGREVGEARGCGSLLDFYWSLPVNDVYLPAHYVNPSFLNLCSYMAALICKQFADIAKKVQLVEPTFLPCSLVVIV